VDREGVAGGRREVLIMPWPALEDEEAKGEGLETLVVIGCRWSDLHSWKSGQAHQRTSQEKVMRSRSVKVAL